ncbi:MAG: hypothetical protein ACRCSG_07080 [Cellulosilyticaceae bacterium]
MIFNKIFFPANQKKENQIKELENQIEMLFENYYIAWNNLSEEIAPNDKSIKLIKSIKKTTMEECIQEMDYAVNTLQSKINNIGEKIELEKLLEKNNYKFKILTSEIIASIIDKSSIGIGGIIGLGAAYLVYKKVIHVVKIIEGTQEQIKNIFNKEIEGVILECNYKTTGAVMYEGMTMSKLEDINMNKVAKIFMNLKNKINDIEMSLSKTSLKKILNKEAENAVINMKNKIVEECKKRDMKIEEIIAKERYKLGEEKFYVDINKHNEVIEMIKQKNTTGKKVTKIFKFDIIDEVKDNKIIFAELDEQSTAVMLGETIGCKKSERYVCSEDMEWIAIESEQVNFENTIDYLKFQKQHLMGGNPQNLMNKQLNKLNLEKEFNVVIEDNSYNQEMVDVELKTTREEFEKLKLVEKGESNIGRQVGSVVCGVLTMMMIILIVDAIISCVEGFIMSKQLNRKINQLNDLVVKLNSVMKKETMDIIKLTQNIKDGNIWIDEETMLIKGSYREPIKVIKIHDID